MAPKREGQEWTSVKILTEKSPLPEVQCLRCNHKFHGGVTRIRGHILSDSASGTKGCTNPEPDIVATLKRKEEEAAGKKRAAAGWTSGWT